MTEYSIKYLLKHKGEFGVCRFCDIINHRENDKCWVCGVPTRKGLRNITQEDTTPLLKLRKDTILRV